jgi:hypothetical protein
LRALIAQAVLDRNTNEVTARESWEQIVALARTVGDQRWEARAKAEIGQILYMDGNVEAATALFRDALLSQYVRLDWEQPFIIPRWSATDWLRQVDRKQAFNTATSF